MTPVQRDSAATSQRRAMKTSISGCAMRSTACATNAGWFNRRGSWTKNTHCCVTASKAQSSHMRSTDLNQEVCFALQSSARPVFIKDKCVAHLSPCNIAFVSGWSTLETKRRKVATLLDAKSKQRELTQKSPSAPHQGARLCGCARSAGKDLPKASTTYPCVIPAMNSGGASHGCHCGRRSKLPSAFLLASSRCTEPSDTITGTSFGAVIFCPLFLSNAFDPNLLNKPLIFCDASSHIIEKPSALWWVPRA